MSPLSRRRLLGTIGAVGVSNSAAVAAVLDIATTPSSVSTAGRLKMASSDPTALASPDVIGRTRAFNKPTAFYSDFTEPASSLFVPITNSFPSGPGKFIRRASWGSAASALGSATDNSADCLINNKEQQCYVDAGVVQVPSGIKLQAVRGGANPINQSWTSGIICSNSSMTCLQGYAEVVAKLPRNCSGLFPCFWLLGLNGGEWKWEIDFGEVARDPHTLHGGAIQWGDPSGYGASSLAKHQDTTTDTAFRKYGVRWDNNDIKFYFEGKPWGVYPRLPPMPLTAKWPATLVINLAMGGPVGYTGQTDASTPSPTEMFVRSAAMFKLSDWPSATQDIPNTPSASAAVPNWE